MKVKLLAELRVPAQIQAAADDVVDLPEVEAKALIKQGAVVAVKKAKPEGNDGK